MKQKNKRSKNESGPDSAGQSGSMQQIPNKASADSESVEELLEEGNTFEAEAVAGVEEAQDADVSEVRTHQVPEDDVPQEYLDDDDHK
jgi:N utilization substance protein A